MGAHFGWIGGVLDCGSEGGSVMDAASEKELCFALQSLRRERDIAIYQIRREYGRRILELLERARSAGIGIGAVAEALGVSRQYVNQLIAKGKKANQ
jgi:hypothetical protein